MTDKRNWSYGVKKIVACDISNVKHKTILLMAQEWERDTKKFLTSLKQPSHSFGDVLMLCQRRIKQELIISVSCIYLP